MKTWLGWEEAKVTWSLKDQLTWPAVECQQPSVGGSSQPQLPPWLLKEPTEQILRPHFLPLLPASCQSSALGKSNQKLKGKETHWCSSKNEVDKGEEGSEETHRRHAAESWRHFKLWSKLLLTSLQLSLKVASIMDIPKSQIYQVLWVVHTSS